MPRLAHWLLLHMVLTACSVAALVLVRLPAHRALVLVLVLVPVLQLVPGLAASPPSHPAWSAALRRLRLLVLLPQASMLG